jgi:hypothetical protein
MTIPEGLSDITEGWLTQALQPRFPGVAIESFEFDKVIHGTATKVKLRVRYAADAGAPDTLWLKAGMETHSAFMATLGIYEHEARFYRSLSEPLGIAAPVCFLADFDPASRLSVLLLEDLGLRDAQMCIASGYVSPDVVRDGLTSLAGLHGAWYDDPAIEAHPWLDPPLQPDDHYFTSNSTPAIFAKWLAEPRGLTFPPAIRDPERLSRAMAALSRQVLREPHGIIHGDVHVGNSYHVPGWGTGFYDWQVAGKGPPMFDVAYYMGSALTIDDRRASERDLIRHYVEQRHAGGRAAPDFDDAWLGYRRYLAYGCWAWMTNPPEFQPEDLNVITSNRFAAAMDDLDSFGALETIA